MTIYAATAAALLLLTLTPVIHANDLSDEDTTEETASEPVARYSYLARISAYCPGGGAGPRMANGDPPYAGAVSAPARFAFGTHLWIDGVGQVTVADRGSAVQGDRLDVFMWSCPDAFRWGVRYRLVEVLD